MKRTRVLGKNMRGFAIGSGSFFFVSGLVMMILLLLGFLEPGRALPVSILIGIGAINLAFGLMF